MKVDSIDKNEVLRYLGYKEGIELDEQTSRKIEQGIRISLDTVTPRMVHAVYDVDELGKLGFFEGNDIKSHLCGCDEAILLAVTIGSEIERKIRSTQATDVSMTVVLDACATVCVEKAADIYCGELEKKYSETGKHLTKRFSPGYGDFPIEKQPLLLKLVDAQRKIGLCVTQSSMLVPRKSITAVVGVSEKANVGRLAGCENCVLKDKCEFRKKGESCNV